MPNIVFDARLYTALFFCCIGLALLIYSVWQLRRAKTPKNRILISFSFFIIFLSIYLAKSFINFHFGFDEDPIAKYYIDAISWTAFAVIAIRILNVVLWKGFLSEDGELLIPNFIVYLTNFFILLVTLTFFVFFVLQQSVTILATSTGGILLAIGYLAKNPLEAIFAGLSFTLAPMFKKGDRVSFYVERIGDYVGTVKHMGWLHVSIQTKEGHIVHVQNMLIEKSVVTNFSQPMHKPCYTTEITLEYEVPMSRGFELIKTALEELSECIDKYSIRSDKFNRFGITYVVRFWTSDKNHYDDVVHAIHSAIYYKIQKEITLDFGYDKLGSMNAASVSEKAQTTHQLAQSSLAITPQECVRILRSVDIFESLNDSEISNLAQLVKPRIFGPPEKIVRQGDAGDSMFVLANGHTRVYLKSPHHEAIELATNGPGKYFGEMALLTGEPRGAHVSAINDVLLLEIPKFAMAQIFAKQPALVGKIATSVARMKAQNDALRAEKQGAKSEGELTLSDAIRAKVHQFFGLIESKLE